MLPVVKGVPELGDDEEVLTLDESVSDSTSHTLTGLPLVCVVLSPTSV